MATEIITTDDLREFKIELLEDFKKLLKEHGGQPAKKWLKSHEVRKLLYISPGTLQNLRINGTLPYTKIGGILYYDYEDIQKILMDRKTLHGLAHTR
ncbi:MAG TPA: helix-turn-helix domain-containing protein [Bacteroidales bacterium]